MQWVNNSSVLKLSLLGLLVWDWKWAFQFVYRNLAHVSKWQKSRKKNSVNLPYPKRPSFYFWGQGFPKLYGLAWLCLKKGAWFGFNISPPPVIVPRLLEWWLIDQQSMPPGRIRKRVGGDRCKLAKDQIGLVTTCIIFISLNHYQFSTDVFTLSENQACRVWKLLCMKLPQLVFLISGPKQNARSLLTPVSNRDFYALLSGSLFMLPK